MKEMFAVNNNDIFTYDFSTLAEKCGSAVNATLASMFLRYSNGTEELDKIKSGKMEEVISDLINSDKVTYAEVYKARNFLKIAKISEQYIKDNSSSNRNNHAEYDYEWFTRFYENAGTISNEIMQELWAKVLASKLNDASSVSLKTLDALKNLSEADAKWFEWICSRSFRRITRYFIPDYEEFLKFYRIKYDDILKLRELGLISTDCNAVHNLNPSHEIDAVCDNTYLVLAHKNASEKQHHVSMNILPFTKAGNELASIISNEASHQCLAKFGKILKEHTHDDYYLHNIRYIRNDEYFYYKDDLMNIYDWE